MTCPRPLPPVAPHRHLVSLAHTGGGVPAQFSTIEMYGISQGYILNIKCSTVFSFLKFRSAKKRLKAHIHYTVNLYSLFFLNESKLWSD